MKMAEHFKHLEVNEICFTPANVFRVDSACNLKPQAPILATQIGVQQSPETTDSDLVLGPRW